MVNTLIQNEESHQSVTQCRFVLKVTLVRCEVFAPCQGVNLKIMIVNNDDTRLALRNFIGQSEQSFRSCTAHASFRRALMHN